VVAIQEERLSRIKRVGLNGAASSLAIRYCLQAAGIRANDLSAIAISGLTYTRSPEHDVQQNPLLQPSLHKTPCFAITHHLAHACSVFATSGMKQAGVLVVDGAGSPFEELDENEQNVAISKRNGLELVSLYLAADCRITPLEKQISDAPSWRTVLIRHDDHMPTFRSLGAIFNSLALHMFGQANEAGKVMGLAPYGKRTIPRDDFFELRGNEFVFKDIIPVRYKTGYPWPNCAHEYQDLACSAQEALESGLLTLARRLKLLSGCDKLCFSGGVALNSVANERIVGESGFKDFYFYPAAEDSGIAVGAAYYAWWQLTGTNLRRKLNHDSLGAVYTGSDISQALSKVSSVAVRRPGDVIDAAVDLLCDGWIVGWFTGGSEFGPRSLGQRSILCDPRRGDAKDFVNSRVKHRESFRPFAPAILLEKLDEWFEVDPAFKESPFMLRVMPFKEEKRALVPAVVHVDGTGRVQSLTRENNGRFYELVKRFGERTGVPILLNTSFNIMGEPIVETPDDAFWCFLFTGLDALVFDDRVVTKRGGTFTSVLDLYPSLTINRTAIELPAGADGSTAGAVTVQVNTRWGPCRQSVPIESLSILRNVDGRCTVRQVMERLASDGAQFNEHQFLWAIASLRRQLILDLSDRPV
jgi:carbamoyltransferase